MNKVQNKIPYIFLFYTFFIRTVISAPVVDNNAGTWEDEYDDSVGVAVQSTNITQDFGAGTIGLAEGETSGDLTTSTIQPRSFDAWKTVCLDGSWGNTNDFNVDIVDPDTGDPITNTLEGVHVDTDGCIDISELPAASVNDIRVRVNFTNSAAPPVVVDDIQVSWNPTSKLLFDKRGPTNSISGKDDIIYRLRYSVNYVNAENVVVWDTLPLLADGTVIQPGAYSQDDSPNIANSGHTEGFMVCSNPVGCMASETLVPNNSIYWDLGTVPEGTTKILQFVLQSPEGTLNGTRYENDANIAASNAENATSSVVTTTVESAASPKIRKEEQTIDYGKGVYDVNGTNMTLAGSLLEFEIFVENERNDTGAETMYNTVVYDDVSDLSNYIDTALGHNGFKNINKGGTYIPNYTGPDDNLAPFPAIVWDLGTYEQDEEDILRFEVNLLNTVSNGTWATNAATIDSARTTPLSDALGFQILDGIVPEPGCYKGTDNDPGFDPSITNAYVQLPNLKKWGESFTWYIRSDNVQPATFLDFIVIDKIPSNTTFISANFPNSNSSGTIFYASTTAFPDPLNGPPTDYTAAPLDLDEGTNTYWSTTPPADPSTVTWIAFYEPQVSSQVDPPANPVNKLEADVRVKLDDKNPDDPCAAANIYNYALYDVARYIPLGGTTATNWNGSNYTFTCHDWIIATPQSGEFSESDATLAPCTLPVPGKVVFSVTVSNRGNVAFTNVTSDLNWSQVPVNGEMQYASFAGISGGSIQSFDPLNGYVKLSLGPLAPGQEKTLSLTLSFPDGVEDQASYTISSLLSGFDADCGEVTFFDQEECSLTGTPDLKVFKNDVLNVIPSGSEYDYTIAVKNVGDSPSTGTYVLDRVPQHTVFLYAWGGKQVYVSDKEPPDLPATLNVENSIDAASIASDFTPATWTGTQWESPFTSNTVWLAWLVDDASLNQFNEAAVTNVGFRVRNDHTGPETPGGGGSTDNTLIYNDVAIFSDQNLLGLGNQVITTVLENPGLDLNKTGPDPTVVTAGETFEWQITYINSSGTDDQVVTLTDTLPQDVSFISATHTWNAEASSNPAATPVPSSITSNGVGQEVLTFNITAPTGAYVTNLASLEGGTISIFVKADTDLISGAALLNQASGYASNSAGIITLSDEHEVTIESADLSITKQADDQEPSPGQIVTYIIRISNEGTHAAENVELFDTLPAGLSYVSGSTLMLSPGYTLQEPVITGGVYLSWTMTNGNTISNSSDNILGTIPGDSGDIFFSYQVQVGLSVPQGSKLINTIQTTTTTPEDPNNPNKETEELYVPPPDPSVIKEGDESSIPGGTVTWTIQYKNYAAVLASNVYLIETLPDIDGDGKADVTFISTFANGPGTVNVYYNESTNSPTFNPTNPTSNGWTNNFAGITVNSIAYDVGNMPADSGPYTITLYAQLIKPGSGDLPLGTKLTNSVSIYADTDENSSNNTASASTAIPSVEMLLSKSGDPEGSFPGATPGDSITYTIDFENKSIGPAYGVSISDDVPAEITLDNPPDNFITLSLLSESGTPVSPVYSNGNIVAGEINITRVQSGNSLIWYIGSTNITSSNYYRNIGIPEGSKGSFEIFGTVSSSVTNQTIAKNSASLSITNRTDTEPAEDITSNNSDASQVVIYRANVLVDKSVIDVTSSNETWTEAGRVLEYTITYKNDGDTDAENVIINEIIPAGTSYMTNSLTNLPSSATVLFNPSETNATSFEVNLGTLTSPSLYDGESLSNDFNTAGMTNSTHHSGGNGITLATVPTEPAIKTLLIEDYNGATSPYNFQWNQNHGLVGDCTNTVTIANNVAELEWAISYLGTRSGGATLNFEEYDTYEVDIMVPTNQPVEAGANFYFQFNMVAPTGYAYWEYFVPQTSIPADGQWHTIQFPFGDMTGASGGSPNPGVPTNFAAVGAITYGMTHDNSGTDFQCKTAYYDNIRVSDAGATNLLVNNTPLEDFEIISDIILNVGSGADGGSFTQNVTQAQVGGFAGQLNYELSTAVGFDFVRISKSFSLETIDTSMNFDLQILQPNDPDAYINIRLYTDTGGYYWFDLPEGTDAWSSFNTAVSSMGTSGDVSGTSLTSIEFYIIGDTSATATTGTIYLDQWELN